MNGKERKTLSLVLNVKGMIGVKRKMRSRKEIIDKYEDYQDGFLQLEVLLDIRDLLIESKENVNKENKPIVDVNKDKEYAGALK